MNLLFDQRVCYAVCIAIIVIEIAAFTPQDYIIKNVLATPSSLDNIVSITAVGDSIGHNIKSENLVGLANITNGSDLFIFNLEGVLVDSVKNVKACEGFPSSQSVFVSNSSFVNHLRLAPITVANLANNHIFDCGSEGVKETKRVLAKDSILSLGAGQNLHEACEPLFVQTKGLRLAFVSYNFMNKDLVSADAHHAGAATLDTCYHEYYSLKAKKGVDLMIASIHLGKWSANVTNVQLEIIQYLLDSGVDIVIGHSPHIPQAIMSTKDGRLAFFSLGNFIFRPDYIMPSLAYTTIIPRINLYEDGKIDVTIHPARIDKSGIPHLIENDTNKEIISRIAQDSMKLNTFMNVTDNSGHILVYRRR